MKDVCTVRVQLNVKISSTLKRSVYSSRKIKTRTQSNHYTLDKIHSGVERKNLCIIYHGMRDWKTSHSRYKFYMWMGWYYALSLSLIYIKNKISFRKSNKRVDINLLNRPRKVCIIGNLFGLCDCSCFVPHIN